MARGELSFSRVEEAAFNVLYVMSEREMNQRPMSLRKRLVEYFIIFVDWSQMVALLTAPSFGWRPDIVNPIQRTFDIVGKVVPRDSGPFFVSAWTTVFLIVLASIFIAVYAGVSFSNREVASLWPVRALRAVVKLFVTLLFLPLMEFLSLPLLCDLVQDRYYSGYSCWKNADAIMPALSIIALCLFVPLALAMSLSYFQSNPYVADPTARPSGRFDFFVTAVRSALILVPVVLRGSRTMEAIMFSLAMLALCVYLAIVLPYYLQWTNRLRCAMFAILAWLGIGAAVLSSGTIESASGQDWFSALWLTACSVVAVGGFYAPVFRHHQLVRLAKAIEAGVVRPEELGALHATGSVLRRESAAPRYETDGSETGYDSECTDGSDLTGQSSVRNARVGRLDFHVSARTRAARIMSTPLDSERSIYRSAPDRVVRPSIAPKNGSLPGIPDPSPAAAGSIQDEDVESQLSSRPDSRTSSGIRVSGPNSRVSLHGTESAPLPTVMSPTDCTTEVEAQGQSFIERTNVHHLRRPATGMIFASDIEVVCRYFILQGHVRKAHLRLCERIYRRGMDLYPLSDVLAMHFTSFLLTNKANFRLAQQTLQIAESLDPVLDIRFLIFSARRYFDQREKSSTLGTAMNTVLMLEYKKNAAEAHRNHELALKRLTKLWHHVAKRGVAKDDEGQVLQMLTRIAQARKAAQTSFEALLVRFPSVPDVLRSYASFRMDCMLASKDEVEPLLARADALEDAAAIERGELEPGEANRESETASRVSSESRKSGMGAGGSKGTMRYQPRVSEFSVIRLTRNTLMITLVSLILVFTMLFTVTVSTLDSFRTAVDGVALSSVRQDLSLSCVRLARDAHLAGLNGLDSEVQIASDHMRKDMDAFDDRNLALYTSTISLQELEDLYTKPSISLRVYDPTSGADRAVGAGILRNETESLWGASAMYISTCREVATLRGAALNMSSTAVPTRFVYDNSLTAVLPAFTRSSSLYTAQVFEMAAANRELQLFLFFIGLAITEILLIVVSEMLGPILRRMSKRTNGPAAVLSAIPRSMVLELHRTAVSALRMLRDAGVVDEEAGTQAPPEPQRNPSGVTAASVPSIPLPAKGPGKATLARAPSVEEEALRQVSARGRPHDTWGGDDAGSDEELTELLTSGTGKHVAPPSAAYQSADSLLGSQAESMDGTNTSGSSRLPPINMAPLVGTKVPMENNSGALKIPPLGSIPSPQRASRRLPTDADALVGSYMEVPNSARSSARSSSELIPQPLSATRQPFSDRKAGEDRLLRSSTPVHDTQVVRVTKGSHSHSSSMGMPDAKATDDDSDTDVKPQGQLDSMTSLELHGLGSRSSWTRRMSATLSIALAVVSTFSIAAVLMTVSSELYSSLTETNKWASNEINGAGLRVSLVHNSFILARELLVNDNEIVPTRGELVSQIETVLAELQSVHQGLKQGDLALGLQGEDGESAKQEDLLYGHPCLRQNCTSPDTRPYAALVANGVDQLVFHFLRRMRTLLSRYRDSTSQRRLLLESIRKDDDFAFVKDMVDHDLRFGLERSQALFADDARQGVDGSQGITSWLYAVSVASLVVAFGLAYRLVAKRLQASGEQNYDLLALIPQRTVRSVKALQQFYQKEEY